MALGWFCLALLPGTLVAEDKLPVSQVLFADDFESGTDGWEFLDPGTWESHKYTDGPARDTTLRITDRYGDYKPPVRSPGHVALVKDVEVGSCVIQFRVRSTKDTGNHRDCCVFFNYIDDQHFYYVHLGAKPDPHSGQIMIVNEAPRLALTQNETKTPWDDDWHVVRLVRDVDAGTIEVFFDDLKTPMMSVTDSTFKTGRVGIGSFDDMNEFDDFEVRTLGHWR